MPSIFASPIILIVLSLVCCAIIIYVLAFIKPTKKVLLLRHRDRRGKTLNVTQETEIGLLCKAIKGVTYRFFKFGPSFVFQEGGHMVTRFFGVEGTAYTGVARSTGEENISVKDFLIFLWGEPFYKGIPLVQRQKVEEDRVGITIEIDKVDEEENGLPTLTASDINDENEAIVLGKLTPKQKGSTSDSVIKTITTFLLGAAVMYFAVTKGYI